ncbi:proline-rich receptor-like protein kinase PERK9 [Choloepus didactylus]|uniref:proline-rich receptor-like protein kinase PERK9 n=1 Tax=Choloepus didactylus TaxID=27675 RepID=UPI00189FE3A1|nr:proline-rich receptor-like protein kinase PERK9 [Choloepus didactylus]
MTPSSYCPPGCAPHPQLVESPTQAEPPHPVLQPLPGLCPHLLLGPEIPLSSKGPGWLPLTSVPSETSRVPRPKGEPPLSSGHRDNGQAPPPGRPHPTREPPAAPTPSLTCRLPAQRPPTAALAPVLPARHPGPPCPPVAREWGAAQRGALSPPRLGREAKSRGDGKDDTQAGGGRHRTRDLPTGAAPAGDTEAETVCGLAASWPVGLGSCPPGRAQFCHPLAGHRAALNLSLFFHRLGPQPRVSPG